MTFLYPLPYYILGLLTYHYWLKYKKEATGRGGEIERILKLN